MCVCDAHVFVCDVHVFVCDVNVFVHVFVCDVNCLCMINLYESIVCVWYVTLFSIELHLPNVLLCS